MTITFPDGVGERIEVLAKRHGFASVAEYLMSLVEEAELEAAAQADAAGPSALTPRSRAELEKMLDEGMASGDPVEADAAFWAERQRVLLEKIARKRGTAP
jgi:hypothetical protein